MACRAGIAYQLCITSCQTKQVSCEWHPTLDGSCQVDNYLIILQLSLLSFTYQPNTPNTWSSTSVMTT